MNDLIDRQAAIDALREYKTEPNISDDESEIKGYNDGIDLTISVLSTLPSAQPEYSTDEWCTDCKEYDQERHCCPRFNHVIRTTLQDAQRTGRWIGRELGYCSCCGHEGCASDIWDGCKDGMFCPNCGAEMEGQE